MVTGNQFSQKMFLNLNLMNKSLLPPLLRLFNGPTGFSPTHLFGKFAFVIFIRVHLSCPQHCSWWWDIWWWVRWTGDQTKYEGESANCGAATHLSPCSFSSLSSQLIRSSNSLLILPLCCFWPSEKDGFCKSRPEIQYSVSVSELCQKKRIVAGPGGEETKILNRCCCNFSVWKRLIELCG